MMTVNEWRRQHLFQAKAREAMQENENAYVVMRNTWYGEPIFLCMLCGEFESHEKAEVLEHVEAENKEKP